jgi:hypothetical protein
MSALPDDRGFWVCNSVWMLDDFTPENGPIRMVPGSHHWGRLPQEALPDPVAPHPAEVILTGKAGTVVVMNSHLCFCRRDRPQQQYQKQLLSPVVQRSLSPELRHLLALDDPLNDRLSEEVAIRSGFLKG